MKFKTFEDEQKLTKLCGGDTNKINNFSRENYIVYDKSSIFIKGLNLAMT